MRALFFALIVLGSTNALAEVYDIDCTIRHDGRSTVEAVKAYFTGSGYVETSYKDAGGAIDFSKPGKILIEESFKGAEVVVGSDGGAVPSLDYSIVYGSKRISSSTSVLPFEVRVSDDGSALNLRCDISGEDLHNKDIIVLKK